MSSERRMAAARWMGWVLSAAALLALGALWHYDRSRAWESPRWNDSRLVLIRDEHAGGAGPPDGAERANPAIETWAVAVNPECAFCRESLARGLAIRGRARAPVRIAVLVVDTARRPSFATLASLPGDELRWDSAGTWRHRWGHRVYGELMCFDRSGRFVRTLAPLADSSAAHRALRVGESLRREGG